MNSLFQDLITIRDCHVTVELPIPTTVPFTFSELCRTKFGNDGFLETDVRRAGALKPCRRTLAPSIAMGLSTSRTFGYAEKVKWEREDGSRENI